MMFLNYFVWGSWYVTISTYLTTTLKFSGSETGAVFGTAALACMISPFFVGLIADRYFSASRVLATLHLVGAVLLYAVTKVTSFGAVYALMLLYCLCYFPTIALTNAIALRSVTNSAKEFPLIRVFATVGWIVIGWTIGWMAIETSSKMFLLGSNASVVTGLFSLTLPYKPPLSNGKRLRMRDMLGLDALVMLKRKSYLIFALASLIACIPLTFYFSFTNAYLNEAGVSNAAGKMTLGQVSEVIMMLLMPLLFRRITVKGILVLGLGAWTLRYGLLAYGNASAAMWMFLIAILLHGVCYDFFFVTGQMYTDQEAPAHLRNAAQGLITFLTYGAGMFAGSLLSGRALDVFTTVAGGKSVRNWAEFWLSSAVGSLVLLVVVALLFRSKSKIETQPRLDDSGGVLDSTLSGSVRTEFRD
jgi:nucleoside transporter